MGDDSLPLNLWASSPPSDFDGDLDTLRPLEFGSEFALPLENIFPNNTSGEVEIASSSTPSAQSCEVVPVQETYHDTKEQCNAAAIRCKLQAAASPLQLVEEETLTYLNQGQTYHIGISFAEDRRPSSMDTEFRTAITLRLQQGKLITESEHYFSTWKASNPNRNILELDKLASIGITRARACHEHGAVVFSWDQYSDCVASFRLNCLSTDFAAHRRGGEKGAFLRLQLDTAAKIKGSNEYVLSHSCNCLIKVFKGAGAERRIKVDLDKILSGGSKNSKISPQTNTKVALCKKESVAAKNSGTSHIKAQMSKAAAAMYQGPQKETWLTPCPSGKANMLPITVFMDENKPDVKPGSIAIKTEEGIRRIHQAPHELSKPSKPSKPTTSSISTNTQSQQSDSAPSTWTTNSIGTDTSITSNGSSTSTTTSTTTTTNDTKSTNADTNTNSTTIPATASTSTVGTHATDTGTQSAQSKAHMSTTAPGIPKSLARLHLDANDDEEGEEEDADNDAGGKRLKIRGRVARPRVALHLTHQSSVLDVERWLCENYFSEFKEHFKSYTGHLLLKLEKSDFIQICSPAEGIRLYTTLRFGRDARDASSTGNGLSVTTYTQTDFNKTND